MIIRHYEDDINFLEFSKNCNNLSGYMASSLHFALHKLSQH